MENTVCVPLKCETFEDLGEKSRAAVNAGADLVEIWLDSLPFMLTDEDDVMMEKLFNAIEAPILCVCKGPDEKGNFKGSEVEKIVLLQKAIDIGVDFVDVGVHTDSEFIKDIKGSIEESGGLTQLIISYHNFTLTPSLEELKEIANSAKALGADIIKLATYATSESDNDTLFEVIDYLVKEGTRTIGICMGEKGLKSRKEACSKGSQWTYGALTQDLKTAPGQLTIHELKS